MFSAITTVSSACLLLSCAAFAAPEDKGGEVDYGGRIQIVDRSNGGSNNRGGASGGDDSGSDPRAHGLGGARWQDGIPREPMWHIHAAGSVRDLSIHPEDNAQGLVGWWRGDRAVDELIIRIRRGYDAGARRILINRPMGTPGNTYVPGASWLTMDDNKRDELPEKLTKALIDEFDEPVHIVWFVGSDMSDPREYPGWTQSRNDEFYQLGKDETWEELVGTRVTLGGWISTGASGLAIDNSSPMHKREHYVRLFNQLNQFPFNLAIYGEAYPLVFQGSNLVRDETGASVLDTEMIESMPWLATNDYIDQRWTMTGRSDSFPLNEDTTRMFVWLEHSNLSYGNADARIAMVDKYMDMGLIPITNDPEMFMHAKSRLGSSHSSQFRAPDPNAGGTNNSRRGVFDSTNLRRRSVPDQTLPQRYQPRGTGIE